MTTPVAQQLTELRRELATRQRVYPDWVRADKLSQQTADHRTRALADAITLLEHLETLVLAATGAPPAPPAAIQDQLFTLADLPTKPTRGPYADH